MDIKVKISIGRGSHLRLFLLPHGGNTVLFGPHVPVDGVDFLLPSTLGGDGHLGIVESAAVAFSRDEILLLHTRRTIVLLVRGELFQEFILLPLRFLQSEVPCPAEQ